MNRHWAVTLGEVVDPVHTWNPQRAGSGTFDYIDLSAIDQESKTIMASTEIDVSEAPSRARQILRTDDILVSTVRPNLNAVARVSQRFDGATASTGFCVLRPSRAKADPGYLFHWVRSPEFVADMVRNATGASYPAVSDRIIKNSVFQFPTLDEQRRIAAILDKADALRQKRKRAIALLDSLTQSIFLEMFGDRDPAWPNLQLSEVVKPGTIVTYGIVQAGEEFPGGVPYIRTGDIQAGRISTKSLRHTSPEIASKFARSRVESGELVMSIRATVGTVALVPHELDGANLTQGTARIAPGPEVTPEYLVTYLRSGDVQRWIGAQVKGATFLEITLGRLRELGVVVPPMSLQKEFASRVRAVEHQLNISRESLMKLGNTFASLQYRAFSGQL